MANAKEYIKLVTPIGKAFYAKVNTVIDEYKGKKKFMINVCFAAKEEAEMKATLTKLYKAAQALPENKGKEWRAKPRLGFKVDKKSGKTHFTFWTYAFDTKDVQKVIPVFTRFGEVITEKTIGNGSDIKVSYTPDVYYESEDTNGISLYLNQIIVMKLIEFSGGATPDFEFEEFVPDDNDAPDPERFPEEEIPF